MNQQFAIGMINYKKIHIGTSGWNYTHWRGTFYPEDLSPNRWLDYYIQHFRTVEINNSFYHLPKRETFENWRKAVPGDFIFAIKASRFITHMKKLKDPQQSITRFFENVTGLGKKMGPILFQLPPRWSFNPQRLREFLEALPNECRYTFEFRDDSWWNDEAYETLNKYGAAFCIFELAGVQSPKEITTDFIYIRLHGPGAAYQGQYNDAALAGWSGAFSTWVSQGKDVYCYFDNDQNGYAAQNALRLQEMVNSGGQ